MNRYAITYFSDPSEDEVAELDTIFIEGLSEEDARDKCMSRLGSFIQIISCNLTKTCGGPGLSENSVNIGKNVIYKNVLLEEVSHAFIDNPSREEVPVDKKIKIVNRGGKVSNASLIRQKIAEAKGANQDKNFVVDWAVATLGQTRPVAKSYVKNIWAE